MIAILMLLSAIQSAPDTAAGAPAEAEIVVIGRKARAVRWDYHVDKNREVTMCRVTKSSGDPDVDGLGCEATRQCASRGLRSSAQMKACIIPVRRELIAALADARAEERARKADNAQD